MTLRRMTLLVVGLTFLGLIAVISITLEVTLIRHFNNVEQQSVYQNLQRAQASLDNEYAVLEVAAREWARRAETSAFLQTRQPGLFEVELGKGVLQEFRINLAAIADPQGNLAGSQTAGLSVDQKMLAGQIYPGSPLLAVDAAGKAVRGLIALPEGPLMALAYPVPGGGTVIAGRLLDETEVQRLASSVHLPMVLSGYSGTALPADISAAAPYLKVPGSYYTTTVGEETISGYTSLADLNGQPAYILRIDQPRTIYRNGRMVMNSLITTLIVAGLIFALMMLVMLERSVIAPVTRLSGEVGAIGAASDAARRVTVAEGKELSSLSQGINAMLGSLELAEAGQRRRTAEMGALFETSRDFLSTSSIAEMLQGITRLAVERFGLEAAWIGMLSKDETSIQARVACGLPLEAVAPVEIDWEHMDQNEHPALEVMRTGEMAVRNHILPGAAGWQPFEVRYGGAAALPLSGEFGRGAVLCLYSRQPDSFTPGQVQWLRSFANLAGMGLEKVYLFEQVLAGRQRLQTLSQRLVEVQEDERRKIAMELHDEIGQILTGLKLLLDSSVAEAGPQPVERVDKARGLVNELIGRVRDMSLDLRPAMLDDLGLLPALVWLVGRYTAQTNILVDFQQEGLENRRFSPQIETGAYRVVQEGLTNAARYAAVERVGVRLWVNGKVLSLQVEDRGAGFDSEAALASAHTRGLLGMRERATSLGGRLSIETAPGQGTCLTLELPLEGYLERRRNARDHLAGG